MVLSVGSVACTEEELGKRAEIGYVEIALDWGNNRPSGKQFFFYPVDGGEVLVYGSDAPECNAEGVDGFSGMLPTGSYQMIVTNTDGVNLEFRNMNRYETAEVGVKRVNASRVMQQESLANRIEQAGSLFFANCFSDASDSDPLTLVVPYQATVKKRANPSGYVKKVRLYFRIERPESIAGCSGVFTGVSESIRCASERCSATSASIDFVASKSQSTSGNRADFVAGFSVLDLLDPESALSGVHVVYLTLTKTDGTRSETSIDVTGAVQEVIDGQGGVIPFDIPLEVELKTLEDGTLGADVRPWTEGTGSGTVTGSVN